MSSVSRLPCALASERASEPPLNGWWPQVSSTAEVLAPAAHETYKAPPFNFKAYMAQRAQIIDAALAESVPVQYPEVIHESMRWAPWTLCMLRLIWCTCLCVRCFSWSLSSHTP